MTTSRHPLNSILYLSNLPAGPPTIEVYSLAEVLAKEKIKLTSNEQKIRPNYPPIIRPKRIQLS